MLNMGEGVASDTGEDKEDGFALRRNNGMGCGGGTGIHFEDNSGDKSVSASDNNNKEAGDKNRETEERGCEHKENDDNKEAWEREYCYRVWYVAMIDNNYSLYISAILHFFSVYGGFHLLLW